MREAREKLVLALLQHDWTPANTFDLTPKITFGWFNEDYGAQVTVGQPEESPVDGGQTGYSHIDPGGGGPGQTLDGTIEVHVWCHPDDLADASTQNPREFTERCCEEIQRIATAHASTPTNPSTGAEPVSSLAYNGREAVPDPDRPSLAHYRAEVRYGYET